MTRKIEVQDELAEVRKAKLFEKDPAKLETLDQRIAALEQEGRDLGLSENQLHYLRNGF